MFKYLKSLKKILYIPFVICVIFILCYDLWFINVYEIFPKAKEVGNIVYKLCFAFITSFIFYFINQHIKREDDKKNTFHYVAKKTKFIFGRAQSILNDFKTSTQKNIIAIYPTEDELNEICKSILINSASPVVYIGSNENLSWFAYFNFRKEEIIKAIQSIFVLMPHIDTELIALLTELDECHFFKITEQLKNATFRDNDISFLKKNLFDFFKIIEKLEKYYNAKLSMYEKNI